MERCWQRCCIAASAYHLDAEHCGRWTNF